MAAACLCIGLTANVSAEPISQRALVSGVSPLYDIADNAYSTLNIVGTTANCSSRSNGINVVKINC